MPHVFLLGQQAIADEETGSVRTRSSRTVALVAFLAVHAGLPQTRQRIAGPASIGSNCFPLRSLARATAVPAPPTRCATSANSGVLSDTCRHRNVLAAHTGPVALPDRHPPADARH